MSDIYSCLICRRITVDGLKSQSLALDKVEELRLSLKMENYTGFMQNKSARSDLYIATKDHKSRPETFVIINCVLNAPLMLIAILSNASFGTDRHDKDCFNSLTVDDYAR